MLADNEIKGDLEKRSQCCPSKKYTYRKVILGNLTIAIEHRFYRIPRAK